VWVAKHAGQIKQKHTLLKKTNNGFLTIFNDAVMITRWTEKEGEKLQLISVLNETEITKNGKCGY
jgi:hypothetical protein